MPPHHLLDECSAIIFIHCTIRVYLASSIVFSYPPFRDMLPSQHQTQLLLCPKPHILGKPPPWDFTIQVKHSHKFHSLLQGYLISMCFQKRRGFLQGGFLHLMRSVPILRRQWEAYCTATVIAPGNSLLPGHYSTQIPRVLLPAFI
jgi:hypothetical protein